MGALQVGRTTPWLPFFLVLLISSSAFGQVEKQVRPATGDLPAANKTDTLQTRQDSLRNKTDSLAQKRKSEIETTITYSARDSLNSSVDRKIIRLYGDAQIKYGDIQLMAEEVEIDYLNSTLSARGKLDSLGRRVGYPIFMEGGEKYEMESIVYNFKTKKAKISSVVTTQGDAFLHGNAVFKNERNELFSIRNAYTTCNLAHPHYEIIASKAKAIPGDKMIAGPFHMEVNSVPLPLGFFFGIFPSPRKSASGIIIPAYGEEKNRGFFLRNGGYFFDINDYFKLQVTGDIYSKGGSALYLNSNYRKRYAHSGTFNFSYTNNPVNTNVENTSYTKDFRLTWSHSPQTKGSTRFSASVNAATSSFNNNNFLGVNTNPATPRIDNTTRKLSSNIAFSKTFGSLFSLGVNLRHNQDITTGQIDLPLPDASFNVNNIYPFKKVIQGMFFENLSLRYTMTGTNQITNNLGKIKTGGDITQDSIAPFNAANLPIFFKNARKGIRHSIPISTSFKALKFFTLSPSLTYDELWYFEKLNWGVSADGTTPVVTDTVHQFNRVVNYSSGVSLTTRIYGTYFFKGSSGIQAIRHVINPTVSASFQPNFGDPSYGYYQELTLANNPFPVYKSVHEGFVYGPSRLGESASMGFGINNNVEMKVKSKKDTVARKVSLFNTLSINSSYNFLADSFRLAPFSMAANTNAFQDKLNISITATLDPYKYVRIISNEDPSIIKNIRTSLYSWNTYLAPENYSVLEQTAGIGRISNGNIALSTNLSPKGQKKDNAARDKIAKSTISDADKEYLMKNPDAYIDFKIPWNLRVSYNADYAYTIADASPRVTQAMRFNGDFSLTEKWKIVFNSGFDFEAKEITQTYLTIARDLHCWQINLSWVPFGKFTSYNFYIGIKSQMLKDLKLNRTRSFYDN